MSHAVLGTFYVFRKGGRIHSAARAREESVIYFGESGIILISFIAGL